MYVYQRWAYRVDPKRVNEYGTSQEDHSKPPVNGAEKAAVEDKPAEPKKAEDKKKD